jgi:hypothetical protein
MTRLLCAALTIALGLAAESLFDGKTLDHWRDPRALDPPGDGWTIEDGCIKANGKHHITEDLFSKETYGDFDLEWDWRIAKGGNSGVKYRIQKTVWLTGDHPKLPRFEDQVEWFLNHPVERRPSKGQEYVIGFEYQMIDDKANVDAFAGKSHATAALYDMVAPSSDATKPAGEWNHSRLLVQGNHVEHWLNSVKVVDTSTAPEDIKPKLQRRWGTTPGVFSLLGDQPKRDTSISLQNHDADTWFRNLNIRRL